MGVVVGVAVVAVVGAGLMFGSAFGLVSYASITLEADVQPERNTAPAMSPTAHDPRRCLLSFPIAARSPIVGLSYISKTVAVPRPRPQAATADGRGAG